MKVHIAFDGCTVCESQSFAAQMSTREVCSVCHRKALAVIEAAIHTVRQNRDGHPKLYKALKRLGINPCDT